MLNVEGKSIIVVNIMDNAKDDGSIIVAYVVNNANNRQRKIIVLNIVTMTKMKTGQSL
jgi:hypothetical protein